MATLNHHGQRLLALVLVCALGVTMIAPSVGANAAQDQSGLYVGAQATIAYTGGAGVLQRSAPSYDGAVVASVAEGSTVSITEGPVSDVGGQVWYGVSAASSGYVPGFTLAVSGGASAGDTAATPGSSTVPSVAPTVSTVVTPTATTTPALDTIVSADSVQDTIDTLLPGTAMITETNGDGARCRIGPDYVSGTIAVVPEGTVVTIAGTVESATWQPVICGESSYGYIHTDFITYAPGEEPLDVVAPPVEPSVAATDAPTEVAPTATETDVAPTALATAVPSDVVPTTTATAATGATEVVSTATATVDVTPRATAAPTDAAELETARTSESIDVAADSANAAVSALAVGSASYGTGFVTGTNGDGVRCRSAASYSASTITVLSEGSPVTIRGVAQGEWMPITCGGQSGFAHVSFISSWSGTPTTPTTPTTGGGTSGGATSGSATVTGTNGNGVNCRATASYSGSVIAIISEGSQVSLRGAAQGEWQPVTCAGMGGYVNTAFLTAGGGSTAPPASTPPGAGSGTTNPGGAVTGEATVAGTNGQGLVCRGSASFTASILMVMPEGSVVSLNGAAQGVWQPVSCGGQSGFAHSDYLSSGGAGTPPASTTPSAAPTAQPSTGNGSGASLVGGNARVTSALNLRYDASYSAGVAAVAPTGTVVVVTSGPSGGFYKVDWDGLSGWMHGDYLVATSVAPSERGGSASQPTPPTTPAPAPPASGSGSSLVNYAMQYLGYPYVWAGAGPYGFDCSGFTMWVVQNVMGKNITHDMAIQISMGTPVSRGALQPGDLIFFQNTFKFGLSHVGIYIGNGQFIHAENEQTGVRISDLNSDYYSSRWYGATRY